MFEIEKILRKAIHAKIRFTPGKPIEEVRREYGLDNIIKLASNENPLGASPKAVDAMLNEIRQNIQLYPVSNCYELMQGIVEKHKLSDSQIFIDNGLDGVITMIGLSFLEPEDEVLTGEITFPAYMNITAKMGAKLVNVPLTPDYAFDLEAMAGAITSKTKLIFVCNPNNPTGVIVDKKKFSDFMESVPENVIVISDEAYFEFVDHPDYPDTQSMLDEYPNLLILRTFSKIMGLAGIRVGYAMGSVSVIAGMEKAREPFPVNRIAQAGALASLRDSEFVKKTQDLNREGRDYLTRELKNLGFTVPESQTNFVFFPLEKGQDMQKLNEAMLRQGVIIRPIPAAGKEFLRVTIGLKEQNERFIQAFKQALGSI